LLLALLSGRKYADHRKVSHTAVQKAIREGRISTVDGKIDPKIADAEWDSRTALDKPSNSVVGSPKHRRGKNEAPAPALDETTILRTAERAGRKGGGNGDGSNVSSAIAYADARADRETARARLAELELQEARRILVRADEVEAAAFGSSRKARDKLLSMPNRIASKLAAVDDADEIKRLLLDEIELVCYELAGHEPDPPAKKKRTTKKRKAKTTKKRKAKTTKKPAKRKTPAKKKGSSKSGARKQRTTKRK
jgi:hypothetical protein